MNTEEILTLASGIVESWDWATEISRPNPKQLDVKVKSLKELVPIVVGFAGQTTGLPVGHRLPGPGPGGE